MERRLKERVVGAVLLVLAGVIVIPWLLDGRDAPRDVTQPLELPGDSDASMETRVIELDAARPAPAPAEPARDQPPPAQAEPVRTPAAETDADEPAPAAGVSGRAVKGIESFLGIVDGAQEVVDRGPGALLERLLDDSGYVAELEAEHSVEADGRLENLAELVGVAREYETVDELLASPHVTEANLDCGSCHEPHIGVRYGNAEMGGITVTCESCHSDKTQNAHLVPADCIDCHMPRAGKSARKVHVHEGDVRTHIFAINSDAVDKTAMFFDDEDATFARGFVTLDFACYGCHTDPLSGEGGGRSEQTLAALSARAMGIHN